MSVLRAGPFPQAALRTGYVEFDITGSEGGGDETTARKRGTARRRRPYFSILQRKLLEPNDFASLADLARALNDFERHWNEIAEPFDWRFTRDDLATLLTRLTAHEPQLQLAA